MTTDLYNEDLYSALAITSFILFAPGRPHSDQFMN